MACQCQNCHQVVGLSMPDLSSSCWFVNARIVTKLLICQCQICHQVDCLLGSEILVLMACQSQSYSQVVDMLMTKLSSFWWLLIMRIIVFVGLSMPDLSSTVGARIVIELLICQCQNFRRNVDFSILERLSSWWIVNARIVTELLTCECQNCHWVRNLSILKLSFSLWLGALSVGYSHPGQILRVLLLKMGNGYSNHFARLSVHFLCLSFHIFL